MSVASSSIVFRVAGDAAVGFGHVRRSWTLAAALQERGNAVEIVATSAAAGRVFAEAGFRVSVEAEASGVVETARAAGRASVLVVDDPAMDEAALAAAKRDAAVVCFDDTGERDLPVTLVVNGSAGADALAYPSAASRLLGPRYIVLRPSFAVAPARGIADDVSRVLVLTGGGDSGGVMAAVIAAVGAALPAAALDVVVGPFAHRPLLDAAALARVRVHVDPPDLRRLMTSADLAVTAGGQTAYELAACGTPAIALRLVPNQALNVRGLATAGVLLDGGSPDDAGFVPRLESLVRELAGNGGRRHAMASAGQALVDGLGTRRVSEAIAAVTTGALATLAAERR